MISLRQQQKSSKLFNVFFVGYNLWILITFPYTFFYVLNIFFVVFFPYSQQVVWASLLTLIFMVNSKLIKVAWELDFFLVCNKFFAQTNIKYQINREAKRPFHLKMSGEVLLSPLFFYNFLFTMTFFQNRKWMNCKNASLSITHRQTVTYGIIIIKRIVLICNYFHSFSRYINLKLGNY